MEGARQRKGLACQRRFLRVPGRPSGSVYWIGFCLHGWRGVCKSVGRSSNSNDKKYVDLRPGPGILHGFHVYSIFNSHKSAMR